MTRFVTVDDKIYQISTVLFNEMLEIRNNLDEEGAIEFIEENGMFIGDISSSLRSE